MQQAHARVFQQIGREALIEFVVILAAVLRHHPLDVRPEAAVTRRVRIFVLIAIGVVLAMRGDPLQRRAFARHLAHEREEPTHRLRRGEAAVREQAVVAHADADAAGDELHHDEQREPLPREEERRGQRTDMQRAEPSDDRPIDAAIERILTVGVRRDDFFATADRTDIEQGDVAGRLLHFTFVVRGDFLMTRTVRSVRFAGVDRHGCILREGLAQTATVPPRNALRETHRRMIEIRLKARVTPPSRLCKRWVKDPWQALPSRRSSPELDSNLAIAPTNGQN